MSKKEEEFVTSVLPPVLTGVAVLSGRILAEGTDEFVSRDTGESVEILNLVCGGVPFVAFGKSAVWLAGHLPDYGQVICRLKVRNGVISLSYCALL